MEERILGFSCGRTHLELVKDADKFFVRDEDRGIKIADVPNEMAGRSFIGGVDRCLEKEQEEHFTIYRGKYALVKNEQGSIIARCDKLTPVAESFVDGYNYCRASIKVKKQNTL